MFVGQGGTGSWISSCHPIERLQPPVANWTCIRSGVGNFLPSIQPLLFQTSYHQSGRVFFSFFWCGLWSSGGESEKATKLRNAAMETAKTTLGRVRFHYCSASRDLDKTPELAKLDFQPRRMPGKSEKKSATNEAATPATAGAKA